MSPIHHLKPLLICLFLSPCISQARSEISFHMPEGVEYKHLSKADFILPNENKPEQALPIWRSSTSGVYVSVGSERGLMGAAVSNANYLILADISGPTVVFNRVLIEILKIARTPEEYVELRLEPDKLKQRIQQLILEGGSAGSLLQVIESGWWKKLAAEFSKHWFFDTSTERKQVRYWENPRLFEKLQAMARSGRIQSVPVNLGDEGDVQRLVDTMRSKNMKLSILDISNAWHSIWLPKSRVHEIYEQFAPVAAPESILMGSWFRYKFLDRAFQYSGFTFKYLAQVNYQPHQTLLDVVDFTTRFKPVHTGLSCRGLF